VKLCNVNQSNKCKQYDVFCMPFNPFMS